MKVNPGSRVGEAETGGQSPLRDKPGWKELALGGDDEVPAVMVATLSLEKPGDRKDVEGAGCCPAKKGIPGPGGSSTNAIVVWDQATIFGAAFLVFLDAVWRSTLVLMVCRAFKKGGHCGRYTILGRELGSRVTYYIPHIIHTHHQSTIQTTQNFTRSFSIMQQHCRWSILGGIAYAYTILCSHSNNFDT